MNQFLAQHGVVIGATLAVAGFMVSYALAMVFGMLAWLRPELLAQLRNVIRGK